MWVHNCTVKNVAHWMEKANGTVKKVALEESAAEMRLERGNKLEFNWHKRIWVFHSIQSFSTLVFAGNSYLRSTS